MLLHSLVIFLSLSAFAETPHDTLLPSEEHICEPKECMMISRDQCLSVYSWSDGKMSYFDEFITDCHLAFTDAGTTFIRVVSPIYIKGC